MSHNNTLLDFRYQVHHSDCLKVMRELPDNCIDSVVTDPPYGLAFMNKKWDYDVPSVEIWAECLRVLKPGGHLLAFAGTRTQHRMAVRIEDAGFEIRDMIAWVYSSGFPKSHDVSKAFDREAGILKPEFKAFNYAGRSHNEKISSTNNSKDYVPPEPVSDEAQEWKGWGTALKPAMEPITMARKPFKGTIVENVRAHGTGALNIDATRVPMDADDFAKLSAGVEKIRERGGKMEGSWANHSDLSGANPANPLGRWGANFIHDGSQGVLDLFPDAKGGSWVQTDGARHFNNNGANTSPKHLGTDNSTGSAARFFYCSKASKRDKCDVIENTHPTVKPTDLMRYLIRMVTKKDGIVLDPFMGSGTTGKASMLEGMRFIGCELDEEYWRIAQYRIIRAYEEQKG
jgi:site-specific DNA-methyltransferase (adenine-specific)